MKRARSLPSSLPRHLHPAQDAAFERRPAGQGQTWTGFANSEEAFADSFVGKRIQPFWIEEEARALPDTNFVVDQRFRPFAIRDGNLITAQQQYSGTPAAALVIEALGR